MLKGKIAYIKLSVCKDITDRSHKLKDHARFPEVKQWINLHWGYKTSRNFNSVSFTSVNENNNDLSFSVILI